MELRPKYKIAGKLHQAPVGVDVETHFMVERSVARM